MSRALIILSICLIGCVFSQFDITYSQNRECQESYQFKIHMKTIQPASIKLNEETDLIFKGISRKDYLPTSIKIIVSFENLGVIYDYQDLAVSTSLPIGNYITVSFILK